MTFQESELARFDLEQKWRSESVVMQEDLSSGGFEDR